MKIAETLESFSKLLDGKLVIAGVGMVAIGVFIVAIIVVVLNALNKRREEIGVKLPEIDSVGENGFKKPEFSEPQSLTIEVIDSEDDIKGCDNSKENEDLFLTALSIETKTYIPGFDEKEEVDMPVVGAIDYEAIKRQMELEIEAKKAEDLNRLKELANIDNEGDIVAIEDELLEDFNNANIN